MDEPAPKQPLRRLTVTCAFNDCTIGHATLDATDAHDALRQAVQHLDENDAWRRSAGDGGTPFLVELKDAETGETLPVPAELTELGVLQADVRDAPAPTTPDSAPQPRSGTYHVACAFRRYECASTTVEAATPEEACSRAMEALDNDWDAWEPGKQDGPVFVDHLRGPDNADVRIPERFRERTT